jgi:hypothetical protein
MPSVSKTPAAAMLGILIAIGMIGSAFMIGKAIYAVKATERFVTVKGFAEQEHPADLVIWPIAHAAVGDDLAEIQQHLDADKQKITQFLERRGFNSEEISTAIPQITDYQAQGYSEHNGPRYRYSAQSILTLRSNRVNETKQAMQASDELVKSGVAIMRNYEATPEFLFTKLNNIKPEMIAAATKNARHAAEQFAQDSGSKVGAIKNAQQGFFSINDRDRYSPEQKIVRVVTTIQYYLADG